MEDRCLLDAAGAAVQQVVATVQQIDAAAAQQKAALDQLLANQTSQTVRNLNAQILALDQYVAGLDPASRAAVAQQVSQYQVQLVDGAVVQLSATRDFVAGQEAAILNFVSQVNTIGVTLITQIEEAGGVTPGLPGGGGGSGGGTTNPSDPCAGLSPNTEFRTNDPRFPDGFITCADFHALPPDQRPVIFM